MTRAEWTIIAGWLDEWWPGKFEPSAEDAWWVAVEAFDADQLSAALKAQLARGGTFRPSVAEVIAEIRRDPAVPTFAEMIELVWGRGGVMAARTAVRKASWDAGERDELDDQARRDRAAGMHRLVGSFVEREGMDRLRKLNLEDPEYGEPRRRGLRVSWEVHCEAMDGREIAVLVAGRHGAGLAQLDPLAALAKTRLKLIEGRDAA